MLLLFVLSFFPVKTWAAASCECRYTRVNNYWGEVELVSLAVDGSFQSRLWRETFPPNRTNADMISACLAAARPFEQEGVCGSPEVRACDSGFYFCDRNSLQ